MNLDENLESQIRKERILGKAHVADHRYLNHEVGKLEKEVKSLKEHEHPYWSGEK